MKILYVEDNPNDADLAQRWLRKHAPQFVMEVVATQSEAVARLSGQDAPSFDLVLTDLRLPDGDGLSLLTYIRERGLPFAVVVITGTGDAKTAVTALKAGADDYVSKRDDYLERLPLTLENALRIYRAQAARQSRTLKALYAEHHDTDIDLTLRHLQRYAPHIQLDVVRTGDEALRRLPQAGEASRYDVILLDYRLPGLNALETLRELRQDRNLDIPVVLVTGQGDEEVALHALKLGAASYLVKNPGYLHQLPGELENACYRAEIIREQAALKQSEERLRSYFELPLIGMAITSPDRRFVEVNQKLCDILGYPMDQLTGMSWVDVTHADDVAENIRLLDETLRGATEGYVMDKRFIHRDGHTIYTSISARCARRADRTVDYLALVVQEITERKRAEQALRESEERFRSAFDHATIGMALIATDGRFLQVNRSVCELLGYSEQELLATHFQSLTHPDDLDANLAHMLQIQAGKMRAFQMEKRYFHKRGHTVWALLSVSMLRDGDGQPLYFICQIQDITERKQGEEALRKSEERYRSVVESQTELICRYLPDTTLTFVNDPYCRYFDKPKEELIGTKFLELIPEPARDVAREHIESLVVNPRAEIHEHEVLLPNGGIGWQQWVDHAILDTGGKIVEFQAVGRDITERKKIEEERSEGEERLRLALEAGRMGVWEWDTRTNAHKWSKEHYTVMGLMPFSVEPDYQTWADRVHPNDLPVAMKTMSRAIEEKEEIRQEYRIIWPDGSVRWVEGRAKPVYDEGGQCLKVSGLIVDITERKQAEDALRQSEARYRAIVEDQTELICRLLPDGRYTFVNEAYCRYFGRSLEELIGRTFLPFIPAEDKERINQFLAAITPSNPVATIEHRVVLPDGGMRWHQWTDRGIFDDQGRLLEFQCVGRDITQRKQAEERLMESEAQLRLLTELIPQHVWTGFPDNTADYRNQRWLDYTGMTIEEVRQEGWMTALHPDDHEPVFNAIREASSQKRIYEVEERLRRSDGQYRWFLARAIPQLDQEGNVIKWYGTNTDIEDRKQAEEALRLSEDKFSKAFRSSPDAFAISSQADGMILEVNDRWEEILGYARDEAVGRTTWELQIYPNPGERERLVSLVREQGFARDFEVDIRKKSGEIRNVSISAEPIMIRDEPCLMLIVRDITQRKQMEWALGQSQRRYTLAAAAGRVGVWDWNLETNDIYVDPELKALLGYRDDEIRNHLDDWGSHVHPEDMEAVMCAAQDYIEGRAPSFEVEHRWMRKDGAVCWFLARGTLIEGENGVRHIIGTDTDITEAKRAGEALREGEERLRLALEAGRMGVWEWDLRTNAVKWSKEHYTVMGLTPFSVEPDYHTWADRMHPDDLPVAEEAMSKSIEEKGEYRCEYRIIWPDGSVRWVEGRGKPVYDEGGQCLKVSGLVVDITERKQAEKALRESEEALRKSYARIEDLAGRLIAAQEEERKHIARDLHDDLNQQVAALAIGISRLKRQLPDAGDAVQEQIAKLREKTDWLSERIRQVSHELHSSILQHVGLPAALNSYCEEFSDREGITVTLDIRDGVKNVSPDAALCLYRVAQESLRNIARHSGARSAMVALAGVNGAIELRVADQGVGFDPGQAREGRGLGLVSMEERVKLLDGSFILTTQPGAGTELRAQIPLRGEHEQNEGLAG